MKLERHYQTDYLERYITTAPEELILAGTTYQTQVLERNDGLADFCVRFLSPRQVEVTLVWRTIPTIARFVDPEVSVYVQGDTETLLAFVGDDTKQIGQVHLRALVEIALSALVNEGRERYFAEDPALAEEREQTTKRLDLLDQNL
jgi:hypothetical protein